MKQEYYYIDTSSILDLDAYGLIKRLRKVKIVIVPEVFKEIKDRGLKRRLKKITVDLGPQKRAAFVPGLDALDYGESAIIKAMACDRSLRQRYRVYVSNDSESLEFSSAGPNKICDDAMDTSRFIRSLYSMGAVSIADIHSILSCSRRPPNKKCKEHLEQVTAEYDKGSIS